MKTFNVFFSYLLIILFISCQPGSGTNESIVKSNMDVAIEGMVCAIGCAKGIEENLTEMAGIISCEVNFEKNEAHIEFDQSVLSSLDIEKTIEEMNGGQYDVQILKETIEAKGQKEHDNAKEKGSGAAEDPISVEHNSFTFLNLLTSFMKNF